MVLLEFGLLVPLLFNWCLLDCFVVIWLNSSILSQMHLLLLSLNPFSTCYNPYKVFLIVVHIVFLVVENLKVFVSLWSIAS